MTPQERVQKLRERLAYTSIAPWADPREETEPPGDAGWWVHNGGTGMREHAVAVALPYNHQAAADADHIARWDPAAAAKVLELLEMVLAEHGDWGTKPMDECGSHRCVVALAVLDALDGGAS